MKVLVGINVDQKLFSRYESLAAIIGIEYSRLLVSLTQLAHPQFSLINRAIYHCQKVEAVTAALQVSESYLPRQSSPCPSLLTVVNKCLPFTACHNPPLFLFITVTNVSILCWRTLKFPLIIW